LSSTSEAASRAVPEGLLKAARLRVNRKAQSQQGLPPPNFGLLSVLGKLASIWIIQILFLAAVLYIAHFHLQR